MYGGLRSCRWLLLRRNQYRGSSILPQSGECVNQFGIKTYWTNKTYAPIASIHNRKPYQFRTFSATGCCPNSVVSQEMYEYVCMETLEGLNEYFEELLETALEFKEGDVTYGDGVLTVRLGGNFGTYVINRQSPNRQIWLSSPFSGPKRYDFVSIGSYEDAPNGYWVYKQDQLTLHELLQDEIQKIIKNSVDFVNLPFGSRK